MTPRATQNLIVFIALIAMLVAAYWIAMVASRY
jgi:hypothetical protein